MLAKARSIRQKLTVILVTTTMVALLLAGIALVAFDLRSQLHSVERDLVTQADVVALVSGTALSFNDPQVAAENLAVLQAKPDVAAAVLYDVAGAPFASFRRGGEPLTVLPIATQPPGVHADSEWVRVWRPVLYKQEHIGTVFLLARHNLQARAFDYLGMLSVVLTVSLGAALLLAHRLQRSVTGPVLAISEVARQILVQRDFGIRAAKVSEDEVGDLVDVFNGMLDELGLRALTLQQANEALRESDERFQLAVRGSSAGLWDWDMVAHTTFYSPRFKALLGYTDAEFPDLPTAIGAVLHPDDRAPVRDALSAHLREQRPYHVECRLRMKSGAWSWFLIAGMAQRDDSGRAFRMAGSVIDIDERKQAEQVLQEANRAKDEFLATLAHELRNPLAPIRTSLAILKRDEGNGPASHRARDTMERQLAHMVRLVDDLLDISRINSGKIRLETSPMGLASIVETAVELSRPAIEARGHALTVDLPPQDIVLLADATRLAQAVGNLLNNAAKYTPAGGRVSLHARQEQDMAVIEVRDSGNGIPQDMLESVFSLFTQVGRTLDSAQGGLGIGLYLVRSLVELHGGTVTAASDGPGRGAVFTVRVPCLPQASELAVGGGAAATVDASAPGLRVLVVDDNIDAANTLAEVLSMIGHRTCTIYEGQQVLSTAEAFHPDVVLLDIGLPGITGYDVARQLRADMRFDGVTLIAITGWGSEGDRQRSKEAGFDQHLTKPVDFAILETLLLRRAPD